MTAEHDNFVRFGSARNLTDDIECVLVFLLIVDSDIEVQLRRDTVLHQADEAVILLCPNGDDRRRNWILRVLRPTICGKDGAAVSVVTRRDGNGYALFLQEGVDLVAQDRVLLIGQGKRRRRVIPCAFTGAPPLAGVAICRSATARSTTGAVGCCSAPATTPS